MCFNIALSALLHAFSEVAKWDEDAVDAAKGEVFEGRFTYAFFFGGFLVEGEQARGYSFVYIHSELSINRRLGVRTTCHRGSSVQRVRAKTKQNRSVITAPNTRHMNRFPHNSTLVEFRL